MHRMPFIRHSHLNKYIPMVVKFFSYIALEYIVPGYEHWPCNAEDMPVVSAGTFNTLLAAAKAAGLVDTLQSDGPFTVFAPTDEAFANLPEGVVDSLLANPDKLKQVLLYHVVPGKVMASDVVGLSSATTAQGSDIAIAIEGDSVMINNARVLKTDVMASNGVIHVIDTVIVPSA